MEKEDNLSSKMGDVLEDKTTKQRDLSVSGEGDDEDFRNEFYALPEEVQDIIASYSSFFMEKDVYQEYLNDPQKLSDFRKQLKEFGLEDQEITIAMRAIGFPTNPEITQK